VCHLHNRCRKNPKSQRLLATFPEAPISDLTSRTWPSELNVLFRRNSCLCFTLTIYVATAHYTRAILTLFRVSWNFLGRNAWQFIINKKWMSSSLQYRGWRHTHTLSFECTINGEGSIHCNQLGMCKCLVQTVAYCVVLIANGNDWNVLQSVCVRCSPRVALPNTSLRITVCSCSTTRMYRYRLVLSFIESSYHVRFQVHTAASMKTTGSLLGCSAM
jgi:hypothetical protein